MRATFASLTSRLVLITVALVAVVCLLLGLATTLVLRSYLTGQLDQKVQASLDRAMAYYNRGAGAPPPGPTGDPDGDGDVRGQGVDTLTAVYLAGDQHGQVLNPADDGRTRFKNLSTEQLGDLRDVPTDGSSHTVSVDGIGEYRVSAVGNSTNRFVVVGLPTKSSTTPSRAWSSGSWRWSLLGTAAAGAAGAFVVRRQLRPLREVAATAHHVAELPLATGEIELAERVPAHLTDEHTEVGQVGSALNTLLAHVESSLTARHDSEQQVRQFVADASHELRTPLTTIAGYTELARRRPDDPSTTLTASDKVEEESARMTAMVEDLLLLARLDSGRPLERHTVDLSRLLVETVSDARVVDPGHRWQLDLPEESIEVSGDVQRLHQVVTNLLTNARKYTPAGTTITVSAKPDGFSRPRRRARLPPGLADHAFERFARGDAARTRGDAGGAGLGLALVQAIVTAHGGTVSLRSRPGDTEVTVSLPY